MSSPVSVKICGLQTYEHAHLAAELGAGLIGFVHYAKSPRNITPEAVAPIAEKLRKAFPYVELVAVLVDATDAEIAAVMKAYDPDFLQLHGNEKPERAEHLQELYEVGIIKALPIGTASDLSAANDFADVANFILLDAKPSEKDTLPGGNGHAFDWALLAQAMLPEELPWVLSGGLTPENVADAIKRTGAQWVDVSSGVESTPGQKDPARLRAFFEALPR